MIKNKNIFQNLKNFVEKMGIYIIRQIKTAQKSGGNTMLFVFSMAAQLAGAIILLLWSLGKIHKNSIEMCFPGIVAVDIDSEGNGILKKEVLQRNVEKIFLNIWALACIVCGYIMAIFTSNNMEYTLEKAVVVALLTILLIIIGCISARYMSKCWFKDDVKLTQEDMEKMNVLSPISEKEIDSLFEE